LRILDGTDPWREEAKRIYVHAEAQKIEKGYKKRGVGSKEAERRAWATVNKSDKGGRKKGGGGRGKKRSKSSSRKGGRKAAENKSLVSAETLDQKW